MKGLRYLKKIHIVHILDYGGSAIILITSMVELLVELLQDNSEYTTQEAV